MQSFSQGGNPQCAVRLQKKKKILGNNLALGLRGIQIHMKIIKCARRRCDVTLGLAKKKKKKRTSGVVQWRCVSGATAAEGSDMRSCKTMQGVKVASAPFCQQ